MSEFLQTQAWIVERVGWVLIHSAWQIAVVGILTWLVVSSQRRSAARLKYAVLLSGLVTMLILPAITTIVLRENRPQAVVSLSSVRAETQANVIEITSNDAPSPALQQNAGMAGGNLVKDNVTLSEESELQTAQPANIEAARSPETAEGIRFETILQPWLPTIVAWWLAGLLLFALRPLFGWVVVQRLRCKGTAPVANEVAEMFCRIAGTFQLASSVQLLQSALVTAPVLVGWMRPVILLPVAAVNGLTLSQLEAVLAHELAHVRRFDSYFVVLQTFFEALFFFHPVAWWISNQIRHEREFCCDDLAISVLNNRMEYGRALLAVSELKGSHGLFVLGADGGSLIFRVQRLFGPVDTARSPIWASATAMILMLAVSLFWFARRGESDSLWFGKRWIEPGENRPTEIIRIGSPTPATNKSLKPLETVMADALRDCRLSHTHALFAVSGPGDEAVPFLTKSVFNADEPREVYSYLPTRIDGPRASETADRRLFFEVRNWPFPAENSIFLTAIDPEGGELGRITININDKAAALAEVSDFLTKHVPQKLNAEEQKELVNSIGPLGNIGCPDGSFEGAKHLRRMLTASRQQLTDAEINSIILSLPNE